MTVICSVLFLKVLVTIVIDLFKVFLNWVVYPDYVQKGENRKQRKLNVIMIKATCSLSKCYYKFYLLKSDSSNTAACGGYTCISHIFSLIDPPNQIFWLHVVHFSIYKCWIIPLIILISLHKFLSLSSCHICLIITVKMHISASCWPIYFVQIKLYFNW